VTPDAWLEEAEIARLAQDSAPGVLATTMRVPLDSSYLFGRRPGETYAGPPGLPAPAAGAPDVPLQPYDNVMIMRQTGWELQRSVAITGQVKFPGRYSLKTKTDRVTDLIERAGGLTGEAYADGVQFYRRYTAGRPTGGDPLVPADSGPRVPIRGGTDTVTRSAPERIGIDLARALHDPKYRDNVILVGGDSINIPEYDPVVFVNGYVNSPGPVTWEPGKNLDWYVDRAGGYTTVGDDRHTYVTQPNGEREGVKRRTLFADRVPRPEPGAQVYIPRKIVADQPSNLPSILSAAAQILGVITTIIVVSTR
jgi:protein involved in polysaccharide export with SLBB domain